MKKKPLTINGEAPPLLDHECQRGSERLQSNAGSEVSLAISNGEYLKGIVRLLMTRDALPRDLDQFVADIRQAELHMLELIGDQSQDVEFLKEILVKFEGVSRVDSVS